MSVLPLQKLDSGALRRGRLTVGTAKLLLIALAIALPAYGLPRLTLNLAADVCFFGIACAGIDLLLGYGGMLSLGSAGLLGTSAYTVALTNTHWHWALTLAIPAGIVLSLILAGVVGFVLVRLSQHYFAVAFLGLATAFAGLVTAYPNATGGTSGLTTSRELNVGFAKVDTNFGWYVVAVVCAAVAIAVYRWTVAGRRGRILKLVRADELVASVLGVRTFRTRLQLFVVAAFFPALAGAFLFPFEGLITPDTVGGIESVQLVALVIIGGVGYTYGGFVGALIILWIQALVDTAGNYSLLVYGVVFMICAFYLRGGVCGVVKQAWGWSIGRTRSGARGADTAATQLGAMAGDEAPQSEAAAVPVTAADAAARSRLAGPQREARPPGGDTALEIMSVVRHFGGVAAVDDVSLTLAKGTVTALIGSNGAGKSTLVNMVSGVEPLDGGSIRLSGRDISKLPPADRTRLGIARTFQVPRLVEELTVLDNVVLGREAGEAPVWWRSRQREREHEATARERLESAGLGHLGGRPVSTLGTGERKFVELVRALGEQPAVCLLDEPAVGLSIEEIEHLQDWIGRLRMDGAAVLVIDHNLDFVERLADFVYVMDVGRIVRSGLPGELLGTRQTRGALLGPTVRQG